MERDFNRSQVVDPAKKISSIEVIINRYEDRIIQINFYHHQERLVTVGKSDGWVKEYGQRKEMFYIADDE